MSCPPSQSRDHQLGVVSSFVMVGHMLPGMEEHAFSNLCKSINHKIAVS